MKHSIYFIFIALLLFFTGQQSKAMPYSGQKAQVNITNRTGKNCYFQKEGTSGYNKVTLDINGKNTTVIDLQTPAYYTYLDGKQRFNSIYITPGAKIEIIEDANDTSIKGDNATINAFINKYRFLGHPTKGIELYSAEWQKECMEELDNLNTKLEQGGFPEDFVELHKLYFQYAYYNQALNGPAISSMFRKVKVNLPSNYYDFLKTLKFDDANILIIPKWFKIALAALEEMEKQHVIPIDKDHFMQIYASKIEKKEVRSAFLVNLLDFTLQKGYSDNFPAYLESIKSQIYGEKDLAALKEVEDKYATLKEANKNILRGMKAPDFTAVDINGKEYKLSDFLGKVVVLDFWFTGCIPCKAEMPYMDKIAESLKNEDIQFISMSLDTGDQLLATWQEMVKDKTGATLHLNIPQGFKSSVTQTFGIRAVPRIVIIDKNGNIVDSNALRPSDPKLKQTLEKLLGIKDFKEEIKKNMMAITQAEGAEKKDSILKESLAKFGKIQEATPMLSMMMYQVIKSYATEKNYTQADAYISKILPSAFRRDLLFVISCTYFENNNLDKAAEYSKEAAETTIKIQSGKEVDEDEKNKLFMTAEVYGNILVAQGKLAEAEKWINQAYGNGENASFELQKSYVTIQLSKNEYDKVFPLLENFIKKGMGNKTIEDQLKMAYIGKNGSSKGFDKHLSNLKKEYINSQKEEIQNRMVNEPAPVFTLKNMKGETVSLVTLKGKVVILDFWATWCGPCKSSFPAMQKAVNKYQGNEKVAFLFIDTWESSTNPVPAVTKYIEEHNYSFNVLFDLKNPETKKCEVVESYGPKGIPAKYIIDKEGNIRFKLVGFSGSDEQAVSEISMMIDSLL